MQLIACQFDIAWESPKTNFETVSRLLEKIDIQPGALIALPEMFSTGYSMNVDRVAENDPSKAEEFLAAIAQRYQACAVGGMVRRLPSGKGENALVAIGPNGKRLGAYRKNYCFSYADEDKSYDPGDEILVFDWQGFKVCPTICYDLRFPELYRRGAQAGATLFPVLANWPTPRLTHWNTLLKARAIENQAVVIGVNRVGSDPQLAFAGASAIIDCQGKLLAQASNQEGCIETMVAPDSIASWRKTFPALRDMKIREHPS